MSKSLEDILASKKYNLPEEMIVIKQFVREKFNADAGVKITSKALIIIVDNSALAGALRFALPELESKLSTSKKLVIRIG